MFQHTLVSRAHVDHIDDDGSDGLAEKCRGSILGRVGAVGAVGDVEFAKPVGAVVEGHATEGELGAWVQAGQLSDGAFLAFFGLVLWGVLKDGVAEGHREWQERMRFLGVQLKNSCQAWPCVL